MSNFIAWNKGLITKIIKTNCNCCGVEIIDHKSSKRKYCSRSCMTKDFIKKKIYLNGLSHFKRGATIPVWKCLECNKEFKRYKRNGKSNCKFCSKNCYDKFHKKHAKRGKDSCRFGKISHSKKIKYKGRWFHSTWESKFAQWLDNKNIAWEYESYTFDLGDTTYTPDFYLPEFGILIEIKGFWRNDAKDKFNRFKSKYNNSIIVLYQKDLRQLKII